MAISLYGYRDNGSYIGNSYVESPAGYMTMATSAHVKPKDFGLNYKVGSGHSHHDYYCDGYGHIHNDLSWRK